MIKDSINLFGKYISCNLEDEGEITSYYFDKDSSFLGREMNNVDGSTLIHYSSDGRVSIYQIKDTSVKISPAGMFDESKRAKSILLIYNDKSSARSDTISKLEKDIE